MLFIQPKKENPTPRNCKIIGSHLAELFGLPAVFILKPGPTYERMRLMNQGVYFVMSDRYVHLPTVIAMEKTSNRRKTEKLTPVAQYLLLYHLQVRSLEGLTAKDISLMMPYSYESVALGITCLVDVGLCRKHREGQRSKNIHFEAKSRELWSRAQNVLLSPVEKRILCDAISMDKKHPICGINALAHYTMLNPDSEMMVMMTGKEYRNAIANGDIYNMNPYDGNVIIEIWKYPSIVDEGESESWVDRLSLALSLREDTDPRVEKEVERLIDEMVWKD
ncbi:MAG: hypothetical protein ACI39U_07730 [Candidatus Cryptobacteroides sp.]